MEYEDGSGMRHSAIKPSTETTQRFQDLPVDLWHEILAHLQYEANSLNKVCLLGRLWNDLAMPHLYRHVELRDTHMKPQLLFLQTLEENPHLKPLVRTLKVGICPPTHEHGDFIYDLAEVLGTLLNLEHLELLRTVNTPQDLYSVEGNGNTIMRRYWRGEVGKIPTGESTYPRLLSFRVDIPMGYTVYSIFQAQRGLRTLELRYPSHFFRPEDIFVSPDLHKLAIIGETILTNMPATFAPTHLRLDYPASTPLWPARFRKTQMHYLIMPNTHLLRSLEISSTLVEELQLCITGTTPNLAFPSLLHFGVFTSERADERFLQERKFLTMWGIGEPVQKMVELFRHFPRLESLSVMPEGIGPGDWTDTILSDTKLLDQLRECCPNLRLLLWRAHGGREAGVHWLKGAQAAVDEAYVLDYWKTV